MNDFKMKTQLAAQFKMKYLGVAKNIVEIKIR